MTEEALYQTLCAAALPLLEQELGDQAEDALNEVYVKLLKKLRDGHLEDDRDRLRGYCWVTAKNHAAEVLRKPQRERQLGSQTVSPDLSPEEDLIRQEQVELIREAAKGYGDPRALAIVEMILDGYSTGEISQRLGINRNTVKTLKRRTLSAIREALRSPVPSPQLPAPVLHAR